MYKEIHDSVFKFYYLLNVSGNVGELARTFALDLSWSFFFFFINSKDCLNSAVIYYSASSLGHKFTLNRPKQIH